MRGRGRPRCPLWVYSSPPRVHTEQHGSNGLNLPCSFVQGKPQWDRASEAQQDDPVHHRAVGHGAHLQRPGTQARQADHSAHGRVSHEVHEGYGEHLYRRRLQALLPHRTGRVGASSSPPDTVPYECTDCTNRYFCCEWKREMVWSVAELHYDYCRRWTTVIFTFVEQKPIQSSWNVCENLWEDLNLCCPLSSRFPWCNELQHWQMYRVADWSRVSLCINEVT